MDPLYCRSVNLLVADIIFPTFPQWFSNALRARPMHDGNRSQVKASSEMPSHDHALLESLHTAVYENRFINTRPLCEIYFDIFNRQTISHLFVAILPSYLTTYFRQVDFGLITNFPMPPLPPIQPPSSEIKCIGSNSGLGDAQGLISGNAPKIKTRVSSSISQVLTPTTSSGSIDSSYAALKEAKTPPAPVSPSNQYISMNTVQSEATIDNPSSENEDTAMDITTQPLPARYFVEADQTITRMSFKPDLSTIRYRQRTASMSDRSLAMHLYKSYQLVIACREAMWEELRDRIRNRREELVDFGWDDDEELEVLNNRQRFEKLIERYEMYGPLSFLIVVIVTYLELSGT